MPRLLVRGGCFLILMVLALRPAWAADCARESKPVITAAVVETPVVFDTKHSEKDLAALRLRKPPAAWQEDIGRLKGLFRDNISVFPRIKFREERAGPGGQSCIWIQEIDLSIHMDSTIYIAGEFDKNAPWFQKIFAHEGQHLAVDRLLLAKYKTRFADGLKLAYSMPSDYQSPPLTAPGVPVMEQQMADNLKAPLDLLFKNMIYERNSDQRVVDNLPPLP